MLNTQFVEMTKFFLILVCLCLCEKFTLGQNFGYPNQREFRRYPTQQFGFNQNNNGNERVSVIYLEPESRPNQFRNPSNNRRNQLYSYYDQYGRPIQNYPESVYEEYSVPSQPGWNSQGRNPAWQQNKPVQQSDFAKYENNGNNVKFPGDTSYPVQPSAPFENEGKNAGGVESVNFPDGSKSGEPSELPSNPAATEPPATLLPLQPVATETVPVFTSTLPPLTPVPQSESHNDGPAFSSPESTTLSALTPVPTSVSRNNVNFGPSGIFQEPCEVDGVTGSCIPLMQCEPLSKLLLEAKTDPKLVTRLRKAHCGFDGNNPKVCCPTPGIPDQPPPSPTSSPAPSPIPTERPEQQSANSDSDYVDNLPEPPVCGNSSAFLPRVVGGVSAKLGDFPWMALLGYKNRGNVAWKCGGSIVSSKHVLTAAHCIHNLESSLYVVRVGELDLESESDGATPVDVLIKKAIKHENYDRGTLTNDIGILVLERDIQFTELIRPICIPASRALRSNTFENYNPLVAGWGSLAWRGESANILQVVQLPVVSNKLCKAKFSEYKQLSIDERILCAGGQGKKDACQGDSGGPLMQPVRNNEDSTMSLYQIGVVSFGKKCAEPGYPGVYTRVTTFVPWIREKMLGPTARNLE